MNQPVNYRRNRKRRGATAVEFAIVLPLIFLFVLGLFEWARFEMVRQVMSTAAFNGARLGSLPGTTETAVQDRVDEILEIYFVREATTTVTFGDTFATVDVEVPVGPNSFALNAIFGDMTLNRTFMLENDN